MATTKKSKPAKANQDSLKNDFKKLAAFIGIVFLLLIAGMIALIIFVSISCSNGADCATILEHGLSATHA